MSFTDKKISEVYKDILHTNNSNTGISTTTKQITCGDGDGTALSLSNKFVGVQPSADSIATATVADTDGNVLFNVDSNSDLVTALGNNINTQYKEFGLYDFSPTQGYHHPMISNNMMFSDSGSDYIGQTAFGSNSADPATTLDVSGATEADVLASMWYVQDAMTIDAIRVLATCDSSHDLNFHVFSYDLDTSSNHGDLSGGTLLAHINTVMSATATTIKTDTLVIDSASVAAGKIVFAFVENEGGTGDITCQLNVKYHLT